MHFTIGEWEALPYWHRAVYLKGLREEFGPDESAEPSEPSVSDEGLAELEAAGITVIRQG